MAMTLEQAQQAIKSYVSVTPAFIKERYDYWNKKAFDGELTNDLTFHAAKLTGTTTGQVNARYRLTIPSRFIHSGSDHSKYVKDLHSITLTITTKSKMTQEIFDGTLLHEMVHVFLISRGLVLAGHNDMFIAKLREIEGKAGRRIPIGHDIDQQEGDFPDFEDHPAKDVLIVTRKVKNNSDMYFSLVSPKAKEAIPEFMEYMAKRNSGRSHPDIYDVYETRSFLGSIFPVHRSFKGPVEFRTLKDNQKLLDEIAKAKKLT